MRENHLDPRSPGFDSLYRSLLLLIFSFCYCIRQYSALSLTATLNPMFVAPLILLEVFALLSKRAESLATLFISFYNSVQSRTCYLA
ncbi:hypothetical protein FOXYSP1_04131 [Fusarium oxysporum f. sp. phaseoli]